MNRQQYSITAVVITIIYLARETSAFYERPGVSAKEIVENRGYLAEEHYFTTPDGYKLRLTRGTNPLINNGRSGLPKRDPILFSHGILEDSAVFLINSLNIGGPQDFSALDLSDPKVVDSLANETSAKSAAFLAMDLGHEIWLLNRRGFPGSREQIGNKRSIKPRSPRRRKQKVSLAQSNNTGGDGLFVQKDETSRSTKRRRRGSSRSGPVRAVAGALFDYGRSAENIRFSLSKDFWSFSLDEQARYDFPMAVDYVLNATSRQKVATITHSAAGSILLMSLSTFPGLADKLSSNVLWAQGFRLGLQDAFTHLTRARGFLENNRGSIPPAWLTTKVQGILGFICNIPFGRRSLCPFFTKFIAGDGGRQERIQPEFLSTLFYPTSTGELAQLLQNVARGNLMHYYDYGSEKNRLVYGGHDEPPVYTLATIKPSALLSFYTSKTDAIVSHQDVEQTLGLLKVPYKFHLIDTKFSHQGYFYHDDNARLAIIPALQDINNMKPLQ